jgi:hypothetical protein
VCLSTAKESKNDNIQEYLTLRDEHRLRVPENMVLRKIFGQKGNDLCSPPSVIRMIMSKTIRLTGHKARM